MKTQLLCTFAHKRDIELVIDYIAKSYVILEQRVFVFSDADNDSDLYVTYNIEAGSNTRTPNTISIHRKKETNTLYTVNALNNIIREVNNGYLDKSYIIEWRLYENSLLLTDGDSFRRIHLLLDQCVNL